MEMCLILKLLRRKRMGDGCSMKYAVDEVIDDIVVCENLINGKTVNILKGDLKFTPHDGDIIVYRNGEYYLDNEEKIKRETSINERFNRLKRRD